MWRTILFISLFCSVTLNVYFFMQFNVYKIEDIFQQEKNTHSQYHLIDTKIALKKDQSKVSEKPKKQNNLSLKIKDAINEKDYFTASFLMKEFANDEGVETELYKLKEFWLQTTTNLIQQSTFIEAENAITAYLEFSPDDIDFLYQHVELYSQQKLSLLAIKYAYEVQYHVFNETKKSDVIHTARNRVQQEIDALIKNKLWFELRDLVEQVIVFDPENIRLQWFFVRAEYQLGEFKSARNTIEPLLNEPNFKIKAQELLVKIDTALRKPESIPMSRQGEHFIVEGSMNDNFEVSLMLDTGASISLLSEQAFDALSRYSDVTYIKDLQLNTAGGKIIASIYQVAEFSIQDYRVKDFSFAVSSFSSNHNDGLLGMNFLRNFDFHIDQDNSLLILKNK